VGLEGIVWGTPCPGLYNYCTVWVTDAELFAMFESPLYVTITLVEPTVSDEIVSDALPPLSCAVPSTVFPAVNVTGPVGVTVGDEIFAVKVTA